MITFHSLLHMIDILHTEDDCEYIWRICGGNGKPICPHCGSISEHHYKLTKDGKFEGLYKCKDCRCRIYTVRQGSWFEGSNLPLKKWFYAILFCSSGMKKQSVTSIGTVILI